MSTRDSSNTSPKVRKKTDKSLSAERAVTDESLIKDRDSRERIVDDAVLTGRAEADETKIIARLKDDDRVEADERISEERQAADDALESERRLMDSILKQERSVMKAAENTLFHSERKETDRNLTDERTQADAETLAAANMLLVEKELHVATQAALTTRDEFLAIVSHDLKNPIGAISMATELIRQRPLYDTDEETREYIDMIDRNASEALRLISDLLDMERIAAGKLNLQIEVHDIAEIIQHTIKTFESFALAKRISLTTNFHDQSIFANCDRDRLSQTLANLIGNAIKFTPIDGTITIEGHKIKDEVKIIVTDTGPGIAENMLHAIFERFWQIGKHDRRGLGLGLYISKMIMETHGGRIWVESKLGDGSKFHVTLPAAQNSLKSFSTPALPAN